MDWDIETVYDEALEMTVPHVVGSGRPDQVLVESDGNLAVGASPERIAAQFVQLEGTELFVRRHEAFVATGGDLPYDVVFFIRTDGRTTVLTEVRFLPRPDMPLSLSQTHLRQVQLRPLIDRALRRRVAYANKGMTDDGALMLSGIRLSDAEVRTYRTATARGQRAVRERITDEELRAVADTYRRAIGVVAPTAAVQRELGYRTRDLAKRRVKQARERGLLEPAPGERRGGVVT